MPLSSRKSHRKGGRVTSSQPCKYNSLTAFVSCSIFFLALVWAIFNVAYFTRFDLPSFAPISREMPVDIAVTWFNYSDPKNPKPQQPRYHDTYFELKYTLRSYQKYGLLDQVRNVFIVYNSDYNDPPEFLKSDFGGKIKLMPHKQFQPSEFVPHGNRNPTVLSLHRIPGISDWFIKTEDDIFLTKKIDIYDFFFDVKSQKPYILDESCPPKDAKGGWHGAQRHTVEVLNRYFGKSYYYQCKGAFFHTPVVFNKGVGQWFEQKFPGEFTNTFSQSENDKNILADVLMKKMFLRSKKFSIRGTSEIEEFHGNAANLLGEKPDCANQLELVRKAESELKSMFLTETLTWVNVQGPGISDEHDYQQCDELREPFLMMLKEHYPNSGNWEK